MTTSGQTINDRLNAAKYTLAGQSLARCVCKATTEEILAPKRKHLDYLLACSHVSNVSIPQLANMLIERTNQTRWIVVYKALITVHHLMSFGNERFTQYLASNNYSFQLGNFLDRSDNKAYGMSTFIRIYSRYLNSKALSYRTLAIDLCRIKPGQDNKLRTMPTDRLLKALPVIQSQMDCLLEFQCSSSELNNGVINASFLLLFKDLIKLFAAYNDAIINLLEIYFDLNKKLCREAFELYKKFLVRVDKVSDFLKLAESVGIDRGNIPDLRRAPSSLVDALEQHLLTVEGARRSKGAAMDAQKDLNRDKFVANFDSNSINNIGSGSSSDNCLTTQNDDPWNSVNNDFSLKEVLDEEEKAFNESEASSSKSVVKITGPPTKESRSLNPFVSTFNEETSNKIKNEAKNPFEDGADSFGLVSEFCVPDKKGDSYNNSYTVTTLNDIDRQKEFEEAFGDAIELSNNANASIKPENALIDVIPPGYSGGLLLKPETIVQPQINPSIDPQTQYQLLQIQREQAESRQSIRHSNNKKNDNNIVANNSNSSTLTRPVSSLDKRMSAFEDLELVMRQTFKKSEKIT